MTAHALHFTCGGRGQTAHRISAINMWLWIATGGTWFGLINKKMPGKAGPWRVQFFTGNFPPHGDKTMYKIVRHYFKGGKRTIETGLTLEEAQAHCQDPETSSSTCTSATKRRITAKHGKWFDGYSETWFTIGAHWRQCVLLGNYPDQEWLFKRLIGEFEALIGN